MAVFILGDLGKIQEVSRVYPVYTYLMLTCSLPIEWDEAGVKATLFAVVYIEKFYQQKAIVRETCNPLIYPSIKEG